MSIKTRAVKILIKIKCDLPTPSPYVLETTSNCSRLLAQLIRLLLLLFLFSTSDSSEADNNELTIELYSRSSSSSS